MDLFGGSRDVELEPYGLAICVAVAAPPRRELVDDEQAAAVLRLRVDAEHLGVRVATVGDFDPDHTFLSADSERHGSADMRDDIADELAGEKLREIAPAVKLPRLQRRPQESPSFGGRKSS